MLLPNQWVYYILITCMYSLWHRSRGQVTLPSWASCKPPDLNTSEEITQSKRPWSSFWINIMKRQILSSFANSIFSLLSSPLFTQCLINLYNACTRQNKAFTSQTQQPHLGMPCRGCPGWGGGEAGHRHCQTMELPLLTRPRGSTDHTTASRNVHWDNTVQHLTGWISIWKV